MLSIFWSIFVPEIRVHPWPFPPGERKGEGGREKGKMKKEGEGEGEGRGDEPLLFRLSIVRALVWRFYGGDIP